MTSKLQESSLGKPVIYDKETSGYKTRVLMWSEEERLLQVTVWDHTCWIRFMHSFPEDADIEGVFIDIMARVKAAQVSYAVGELELLRAEKGEYHVH